MLKIKKFIEPILWFVAGVSAVTQLFLRNLFLTEFSVVLLAACSFLLITVSYKITGNRILRNIFAGVKVFFLTMSLLLLIYNGNNEDVRDFSAILCLISLIARLLEWSISNSKLQ